MMPSVKEPLAGLALLVIFGFLIWYNRPIENPRLVDPYPQGQTPRFAGEGAYEAWLWQDPFAFDPAEGSGGMAEAWASAARGEKPDNSGISVSAGLMCQDSLKNVLKLGKEGEVGPKSKPEATPKPVILAPLVKVAPDTMENKEIRTRQRYAVVAGLVESGYRPQEPEVLHFCTIQKEKGRREYDMRWEHYRHNSNDKSEDGKPDIVVAWIDSEIFTAESKFPVGHECTRSCNFAFKNLLKEISKNNTFYLFDAGNILDSKRSCQIEKHIDCIHDQNAKSAGAKGNNDKKIQLIKLAGMEAKEKQDKCNAPSAQAGKECWGTSKESAGKPAEEPEQCDSKNTSEETGSEKLAGLLARELRLRGITHWSEVMTISEQNSENVAALAGNIRECLSELFAGKKCARPACGQQKSDHGSEAGSRADEIRNVFYLKSLDGNPKKTGTEDKKDKDKKDKNEAGPADKTEKVPSIDLHHSPPLPLGSGQLDYFHRLAEEIKNVHHTVDFNKRDSGIRSVVILGSDFNDKLLIIQALREKMPHLLILTTDLDAQMLYPKHWRSTRNLVVASHFDLRLREKTKADKNEVIKENKNIPAERLRFSQRAYQHQFPPFRNSQQTNIFYRTRSIAEGDVSSIEGSEVTFPQIFEVGRNGFVRPGTAEKNNMLDYHPPDNTFENNTKELGLLFAIVVSLIFFHSAIRPGSALFSIHLFSGTLLIFALAFGFGTDFLSVIELKELRSFIDKYPLIWLLIGALLIGFLGAIRSLPYKSAIYLLISPVAIFAVTFGFGVGVFTISELREPFSFTDGVSLWPTLFIQIIAVLLALSFFVQTKRELKESFYHLSRRYFLNSSPTATVCAEHNQLGRCELWLRRLKEWGTFAVLFVVLIVTITAYAWNDVYPSEFHFSFWDCFLTLALVAIFYQLFVEGTKFPEDVSIKHWAQGDEWHPPNRDNHERILWWQYNDHGKFVPRLTRVIWIWLIFAIIETLLVYLLPPWPLPWRGATDPVRWNDMTHLAPWIGVLSFTVTMLLLFFILDAVRLNFYWIRKLHTQHPLLTGQPPGPVSRASRRRLERMVLLVAERTQAVDRLVYYPMFCIMLILFAKITFFDNQEFPLSKGITFGAAISFLFFSGFVLRREANELRHCVRRRVRDTRTTSNTQEIDETIRRIDAIDEGAFQSMLEQPVMQALLLILASIGLFAGEYLKVFG